jgi:dTDP-4-dehydrorhamnose reductase
VGRRRSPVPLSGPLLITGGSGYLGRELVARAAHLGREVVATSFSRPGVRLDVRDAEAVLRLVRAVRPGAVIHAAYVQDGPEAWSVTVAGAEHVARAAARTGTRLVHVSTDVVFDGRKGEPYTESDRPSPVTAYGRAKAEAERRVERVHAEACIVRTSLLYGGAEPSTHERAAVDGRLTFFTDEIRCPIHVGDLAQALLELIELSVSGPLHVAGADPLSRHEFAELLARRPVRGAPAPPNRPLNCALDSSLARTMIRTRLRGARTVLT